MLIDEKKHNAIRCGRYMPAVQKMLQNSESPTKPQVIYGHLWGVCSVLAGSEGQQAPHHTHFKDRCSGYFNEYCNVFHRESNPEDYIFYMVHNGERGRMSPDNIRLMLLSYEKMSKEKDGSIKDCLTVNDSQKFRRSNHKSLICKMLDVACNQIRIIIYPFHDYFIERQII